VLRSPFPTDARTLASEVSLAPGAMVHLRLVMERRLRGKRWRFTPLTVEGPSISTILAAGCTPPTPRQREAPTLMPKAQNLACVARDTCQEGKAMPSMPPGWAALAPDALAS